MNNVKRDLPELPDGHPPGMVLMCNGPGLRPTMQPMPIEEAAERVVTFSLPNGRPLRLDIQKSIIDEQAERFLKNIPVETPNEAMKRRDRDGKPPTFAGSFSYPEVPLDSHDSIVMDRAMRATHRRFNDCGWPGSFLAV